MNDEGAVLPKVSPFETQFVEALGVQTAYVTAGQPDGRPVLLLHGMSSSADNYRETMAALAGSRWLIAPDIPGFGQSEETQPYTIGHLVEWLAAFREALDLPPLDLVGHSFGGTLATSFALSYPEDVASLLLSAPALLAAVGYPDFVKKMMIWLRLPESGTAVSQSNRMVQQAVRNSSFAPEKFDDDVWQRRVWEYHHARSSAEVLKALAFYDVRPELPPFKCASLHHLGRG
ncbi:MAG: alpha/beta fold hydrolase [Chloroflexi bacterium]|nr:alpha/beta fold hydrolase [Chloroflexota bacterium]